MRSSLHFLHTPLAPAAMGLALALAPHCSAAASEPPMAYVEMKGASDALQYVAVTRLTPTALAFRPDAASQAEIQLPLDRVGRVEFELPAEDLAKATEILVAGNATAAAAAYEKVAAPFLPFATLPDTNATDLLVRTAEAHRAAGNAERALSLLRAHTSASRPAPPSISLAITASLMDLDRHDEATALLPAKDVLDEAAPFFLLQQLVRARSEIHRENALAAADALGRGIALGDVQSRDLPELLFTAWTVYGTLAKGQTPDAESADTPDSASATDFATGQRHVAEHLQRFFPESSWTKKLPATPTED